MREKSNDAPLWVALFLVSVLLSWGGLRDRQRADALEADLAHERARIDALVLEVYGDDAAPREESVGFGRVR